ncbi:hypothetical protein [Pseudotabrizicola algicola]|uniref:Flagellar FliJ protein n=1 Tax=Pseudotabrizicola algicola TaxID=2709381 RepID=A0A6B3RLZ5_9RHOB|nr:hypothetical protein [Pseudotabrizicola algicola]NEX45285.1 hypothetical protein [Pseudotabrizicola algicola]
MTSRARLFDLYARRESARAAGLGRAVVQVTAEQAEAEARSQRLRHFAQEIQVAKGPLLAADLRALGHLAATLVQEAESQDVRAEAALREAVRLRKSMSQHDRRRHFGETAAMQARLAEAEEAEARAEASRPPARRQW